MQVFEMYKCNSKCKDIFALIRFSDTFYLVVTKFFFIPRICPPDVSNAALGYFHTIPDRFCAGKNENLSGR